VPRKAVALAFVLGAAAVPGYAPFYIYPLPLITVAAIAILLLRADSTFKAASIGFASGLGLLTAGTSWVYVSLHDYGGMPMPVAAVSTLTFSAIYAVCPGIAGAVVHRTSMPATPKLLMLFPAAWALADWMRGWLFTGFPWLALGYSQAPASPLAGFSPVFGVYGVSLASAFVAGCIALVFLRFVENGRPGSQSRVNQMRAAFVSTPALLAGAVVVSGFGLGAIEWTVPVGTKPTRVSLIQGNIPQELKWKPEKARETLISYLELARASQAELIVLPETALPMFNVNLPQGYLDQLGDHARAVGGDLLTGVPEYEGPESYYNSVISLGTSPSQTYRKVHLVPFGDFFPLRWALGWFLKLLDIPMSDFSRGAADQRPIEVAGQKVAVNICYEDVFGEEIIRQLPEATILANFTNDAWWGRSLASRQHLQMSQMRSLETGRGMLRATNTGVTAVIDHRGRVQAIAPEFETTVINADVFGYAGVTPYMRWGNYAFLLITLVMVATSIIVSQRVASRRPDPTRPVS
jgi:apolipoprotein N-acyltransferase